MVGVCSVGEIDAVRQSCAVDQQPVDGLGGELLGQVCAKEPSLQGLVTQNGKELADPLAAQGGAGEQQPRVASLVPGPGIPAGPACKDLVVYQGKQRVALVWKQGCQNRMVGGRLQILMQDMHVAEIEDQTFRPFGFQCHGMAFCGSVLVALLEGVPEDAAFTVLENTLLLVQNTPEVLGFVDFPAVDAHREADRGVFGSVFQLIPDEFVGHVMHASMW